MRWILAAAFLAMGCASSYDDAPPPFAVPGTSSHADNDDDDDDDVKTKSEPKGSSGYVPQAPAPSSPPAPTTPPKTNSLRTWTGTIATTQSVHMGGGDYCEYGVTLTNVRVQVNVDGDGKVLSGSIGTGTSYAAQTGCEDIAFPMRFLQETPNLPAESRSIALPLMDGGAFHAKASIRLGPASSDRMSAHITVERVLAQDALLNWTVNADLELALQGN